MKKVIVLTSSLLNLKRLASEAKKYFTKVEVLNASEIYRGMLLEFFNSAADSTILVVVDVGNFVGGYQGVGTLLRDIQCHRHYITHIPNDCPLIDQLTIHVVEANEALDRTIQVIQGLHDNDDCP